MQFRDQPAFTKVQLQELDVMVLRRAISRAHPEAASRDALGSVVIIDLHLSGLQLQPVQGSNTGRVNSIPLNRVQLRFVTIDVLAGCSVLSSDMCQGRATGGSCPSFPSCAPSAPA